MRKSLVSLAAATALFLGAAHFPMAGGAFGLLEGPPPPKRRRSIPVAPRPLRDGHIGPSCYMPHIGAKERARHAGKPDGVMHAVPPIHLRNAAALAASKRKPRKAVAS